MAEPTGSRGSRRLTATGVALVLAATGGGTGWWLSQRGSGRSAAHPTVPVSTATVERTDLKNTTRLSGTLGYAGSHPLLAQAHGTVTGLPSAGQVISRGQLLYEVDGRPVRLFYGPRPAWRPLEVGVPDGPDVTELEQNLVALGYASLTPDARFTAATAAAVRRWQHAIAEPETGQVPAGTVAYEPGPIRIASVTADLGAPVSPGEPVCTATSTTMVVTVAVPAGQIGLVHVGDTVSVRLPAENVTPGRVTELSPVAAVDTGAPEQGRPPAQATVPAIVTLTTPGAAAGFDHAPVSVDVTSQAVTGVLAVPVTALVALGGGGYGVYLRTGDQRRLVPVTPGSFADTLVEIREGLRAGDVVEVPAG
jgi:peptidoglycan hydrolase-like protein with peptidoglycan-binding domain